MPQRLFEPVPGVLVQTSNMWQMNSLVVTGAGRAGAPDATVVIDPGWFPDEVAGLQALAASSPAGRPTHILLTHPDFDHVVGWAEFAGAQLIAHPAAAERDPARSQQQVEALDGQFYVVRQTAYRYPPTAAFTSPASLDLGGGETALFCASPGHVEDALFTVLPERRVLIAGDYLSDLEFPFVYHSFAAYRETLQQAGWLCRSHGIDCLIPGHGRVAESRTEIRYRIDTDMAYLDDLMAKADKLIAAGAPVDEAVARLSDFNFRGAPIAPHLAGEHERNIRFLYARPEQAR